MLRWLFLILLVCNVALFAWGYRLPMPEQNALPPLPVGAESIYLLGEAGGVESIPETAIHTPPADIEGKHAVDAVSKANTPEDRENGREQLKVAGRQESDGDTGSAPDSIRKCVRLGPFEQEEVAFDLIATLADAGQEADIQVLTEKTQSGYWVLITPSTEEPDFLLSNLELAGIGDVWRFSKGDLAGSVSLGLYSAKSEAENRLQELREKGFAAEIRSRDTERYTYWVQTRYDSPMTQEVSEVLEQVFNKYPWMSFPPPPCVDIASTEGNQ